MTPRPATELASVPPPGFAQLQLTEFGRLFGSFINTRLFIAPVVASLVLGLALWEGVPWRQVLLVSLPLTVLAMSLVEARRFRREGITAPAIERNLLLAVVGQLLLSFATGGLESPVMPLLPVVALFWALVVVGRPSVDVFTAVVQLSAPWLFAAVAVYGLLPDFNLRALGGGTSAGHSPAHLLTSAALLNAATVLARSLGRAIRGVFDSILWRALEANEALRREYGERAQAQVLLTGEIAHELKNPLASVKGLSSLLAQNVEAGKGQERLQVLRQEVDRMQEVLDEFLTFSRPLLPLAVEPVELGHLCRQVAELHEGLARQRGVNLLVRGQAQLKCDVRKVRQILINLVQNALDAAPEGSTVELDCQGHGAGARVEVLDRGSGVDPSVQVRLFQPGVTSKPRGNGIGLTVSRALARQHGGEVELLPRQGGGCRALVVLP